jgi:hypothetical protein
MSLNICRGNLSLEHLLVRRFKKIFFKYKNGNWNGIWAVFLR